MYKILKLSEKNLNVPLIYPMGFAIVHMRKKKTKKQQTNKTKQCKKEDLKKAKQQQINK